MQNKSFAYVLIIVLGILIGLGIVAKQNRSTVSQFYNQQQQQILNSQNRIEQLIASSSGGDQKALIELMANQKSLERRIEKIEAGLQGLAQLGAQPQARPPQPPPEDMNKVHDIPVAHTPIIGNQSAKVTITEFVDFECPFCARFHTPFSEAAKAFPQDVRILTKHFPLSFHPNAKPASKAAMAAAEQGKFGEMVDELLKNGRSLNEETFKKLAGDLGLNVDQFMADYKNKDAAYEEIIQKDLALGQEVNVRGTPTFFINGKKTNARDVEAIKAEIEALLK